METEPGYDKEVEQEEPTPRRDRYNKLREKKDQGSATPNELMEIRQIEEDLKTQEMENQD